MQDRSLTVSTTKFWGLTILFCSKQYSMLTFQAESDLPHAFPISGNGMVCSAVQLSLFSLFKRRHGTGSGHSCPLGQSKSHSQAQSLRSRDILATKHEAVAKEWMQRGVMLSAGPNRPDPKSPPLEEFEISLLKGFFLLHFLYHQLRF